MPDNKRLGGHIPKGEGRPAKKNKSHNSSEHQKACEFYDKILSYDHSSSEKELVFISEHGVQPKNVVSTLVRKSIQNCPHKKWCSMSDEKKEEYADDAFKHAYNLIEVKDQSEIDKLYDFSKQFMDIESIEIDHMIAKKYLAVQHYLENSNGYNNNAEFYNGVIIPLAFQEDKVITSMEEELRRGQGDDYVYGFSRNQSALGVVTGLPIALHDCNSHAFGDDYISGVAPGESLFKCNEQLSGSGKYTQIKDQINYDLTDSILIYGTSGENGGTVKHFTRNVGDGFFSTQRGDGSQLLIAHPAVDQSDGYGKPLTQWINNKSYNSSMSHDVGLQHHVNYELMLINDLDKEMLFDDAFDSDEDYKPVLELRNRLKEEGYKSFDDDEISKVPSSLESGAEKSFQERFGPTKTSGRSPSGRSPSGR